MDDSKWEKLSFVQMSPNRKKVLKVLVENSRPCTPTEIKDELEIAFNSVSRALRQLEEKKLVRCINPDSPRYRRYRVTEEGEIVLQKILEIEE